MISEQFMKLLDDINEVHLSESDVEKHIEYLKRDWSQLQYLWSIGDKGIMTLSTLFYLSRRAFEIVAAINDIESVSYYIQEAKEIHRAKNAGYSGNDPDAWSNFRECTKFGIRTEDGIVTRLSDKYVRFNNLYTGNGVDKVGEKLTDSLLDFANYCAILICVLEE